MRGDGSYHKKPGAYNDIIPEKKCAKCGKNFIVAPYHVFHKNKKYYCSWTCYNHRNDKTEEKKNDNRQKH